MVILGLIVVFLLPLLGIPAITAQAVGPLPAVSGLASNKMEQDTLIYDRHGTLLADIGKAGDHRIVVPLTYISPWVVKPKYWLAKRITAGSISTTSTPAPARAFTATSQTERISLSTAMYPRVGDHATRAGRRGEARPGVQGDAGAGSERRSLG